RATVGRARFPPADRAQDRARSHARQARAQAKTAHRQLRCTVTEIQVGLEKAGFAADAQVMGRVNIAKSIVVESIDVMQGFAIRKALCNFLAQWGNFGDSAFNCLPRVAIYKQLSALSPKCPPKCQARAQAKAAHRQLSALSPKFRQLSA